MTITCVEREHLFTIDELGVNEALEESQSVTIKFDATEGDRIVYYCGIHLGMQGLVEVKVPSDRDPPLISDVIQMPANPYPLTDRVVIIVKTRYGTDGILFLDGYGIYSHI